jgi:hypothetical protein
MVVTVLAALLSFNACASSTPTPTATPTLTSTPAVAPTPSVFGPGGGPSFIVYDTLYVELIVPDQVLVGDEVSFQLAFANIGSESKTFYHGPDLAEFILLRDGEAVMSSHDQLIFGDIKYTNTLGPSQTRRLETGFDTGTFFGVLIDEHNEPLPPGTYEIYGIAHMTSQDDGTYETYSTPETTIEIVAP